MTPTVTRYPLDPTGINANNLVVGEEHLLVNRKIRSIATTYGAYFTESLIVTDMVSNQVLVRNQHYYPAELYELPSAKYGKEICAIIVITDETVSNQISIQYQALGGEYSTSSTALIELINNLAVDDRPVSWPNIIGKPEEFEPSLHLHDIGDVYGFEYVVHAIDRLRQSIELGDRLSHDQIYQYIDQTLGTWKTYIDTNDAAILAKISNVKNYDIATTAEAQAGTVNNKYMTPLRVREAINFTATAALATYAEAQAGVDNTKTMTPLRVKEVVTVLAVTPMNQHITNYSNPHNVTKTQVGLNNIPNATTISRTSRTGATLLLDTAMADHVTSGDHDARYVQKAVNVETSLQVVSGQLQAFINGAWRIVWPPQWQ